MQFDRLADGHERTNLISGGIWRQEMAREDTRMTVPAAPGTLGSAGVY